MHGRMRWAGGLIAILSLGTLGLHGQQAFANEKGMVGVRCGRTALSVLKVYGNPTRVRIGSTSFQTTDTSAPSPMAGMMPPGAGGPPMLPSGVDGGFGSGKMAFPGGGLPPATVDMSGAGGGTTTTTSAAQEVIWTYELSNGRTLEVYVDQDGNVDQVTVSGYKWTAAKTANGITLGDPYKKILAKYGFPDKHEYLGALQMVRYTERSNVAFVLDPKTLKVVAIVVSRPS